MSDKLDVLRQKIAARKSVIGVIGLGYVGLPLRKNLGSVEQIQNQQD